MSVSPSANARRFRRTTESLLAVSTVLCSLLATPNHAAEFIPLGRFANSVSSDGTVVVGGVDLSFGGNSRPFRWTRDGGMELLDDPSVFGSNITASADLSTLGWWGKDLQGHSISRIWTDDDGLHEFNDFLAFNNEFFENASPLQIPSNGDYVAGGRDGVPVRWTAQGGFEPFELPPGTTRAAALATARDGQSLVVGTALSNTFVSSDSLFRWTEEGGYAPLGTVADHDSYQILDVSADGAVITGTSYKKMDGTGGNGDPNSLWRWTAENGMEVLEVGTTAANFRQRRSTQGRTLSADGSVLIGERYNNADLTAREAYRWTEEGGYQSMLLPGYANSSAYDITPDGHWILGSSFEPLDPSLQEVSLMLWSERTGLLNLQDVFEDQGIGDETAAWQSLVVFTLPRISADGLALVGSGRGPDGVPAGWVVYLNPIVVPEPRSLLLCTLALGGVGLMRCRFETINDIDRCHLPGGQPLVD